MVKEFEYNGLTYTDWIGFQFEYKGDQYTVVEMIYPGQYVVTQLGKSLRMSAQRVDLMHHYILQLEATLDKIDRFDY